MIEPESASINEPRLIRVRSLFLSDLHLGCRFSRVDELFAFLDRVEPDRLYLVGDIVDGWKMKCSFFWSDSSSFVVRRILDMLKRGTKVFYTTGNHDESSALFHHRHSEGSN